jgi:hypothetical protein
MGREKFDMMVDYDDKEEQRLAQVIEEGKRSKVAV